MITVDSIKKRAKNDGVSSSLIFKEHVHLVVLEYLFRKGLFSEMVFQGGTALRLAYGGIRYSEDLDFVLRQKDLPCFRHMRSRLQPLAAQVSKFIPFAVSAELTVQKETSSFKRYCLTVKADFLAARDKTNIEVANIPSYKSQPVLIQHPDVSVSPAVNVETPEEILSDKLVAFGARDYIKGRDIWDIHYLIDTMRVDLTAEVIDMVRKKINDYNFTKDAFLGLYREKLHTFKTEGERILREEMDRFLPAPYRALLAPGYPDICRRQQEVFSMVLKELGV